ncbi:hypothetical protein Vadar_016616 [Vaccinium darrowii]|uniref:Uncharacterized protein n=1 Tax=Vaccinium darrowii TaxID=229202 RepID=A0ACB7YPC0_9ERIC|nr:hypothetical protein Vadar_016616 [Vaccinium darrowii]
MIIVAATSEFKGLTMMKPLKVTLSHPMYIKMIFHNIEFPKIHVIAPLTWTSNLLLSICIRFRKYKTTARKSTLPIEDLDDVPTKRPAYGYNIFVQDCGIHVIKYLELWKGRSSSSQMDFVGTVIHLYVPISFNLPYTHVSPILADVSTTAAAVFSVAPAAVILPCPIDAVTNTAMAVCA